MNKIKKMPTKEEIEKAAAKAVKELNWKFVGINPSRDIDPIISDKGALSYEEIAEASLEQANIAVKLWECPN